MPLENLSGKPAGKQVGKPREMLENCVIAKGARKWPGYQGVLGQGGRNRCEHLDHCHRRAFSGCPKPLLRCPKLLLRLWADRHTKASVAEQHLSCRRRRYRTSQAPSLSARSEPQVLHGPRLFFMTTKSPCSVLLHDQLPAMKRLVKSSPLRFS